MAARRHPIRRSVLALLAVPVLELVGSPSPASAQCWVCAGGGGVATYCGQDYTGRYGWTACWSDGSRCYTYGEGCQNTRPRLFALDANVASGEEAAPRARAAMRIVEGWSRDRASTGALAGTGSPQRLCGGLEGCCDRVPARFDFAELVIGLRFVPRFGG